MEVWTSIDHPGSQFNIFLRHVLQIRISLPSTETSHPALEKSEKENKNEKRRQKEIFGGKGAFY